jgi:hypothetical protein
MTADRERTPRLPPRLFVRSAWVMHRAIYRFTGGRRGLWRPKAGGTFGTMRLTTLGRRWGQPPRTSHDLSGDRVAMTERGQTCPDAISSPGQSTRLRTLGSSA